ncbi:hypothetical protein GCM10009550_67640 [Actinocorallia libanotica]|uniref:Uncharacterized protein n=1 Tax=Actinocorallia libanotica TaxID=46162 RepID=A0ABN1RWY0_9ACTN
MSAAVVGVPDERWDGAVKAVTAPRPGGLPAGERGEAPWNVRETMRPDSRGDSRPTPGAP